MKIELSARRSEGEPGWVISAYADNDYRGESLFIYYTKREALQLARQQVKEMGGLGIWATR